MERNIIICARLIFDSLTRCNTSKDSPLDSVIPYAYCSPFRHGSIGNRTARAFLQAIEEIPYIETRLVITDTCKTSPFNYN